jgi:DNA-binding response OmpR family regulator
MKTDIQQSHRSGPEVSFPMQKEKIILVEDDPDIAELVQFNLEREGYRVITCTEGDEGLAEIIRTKPNMVILDLMLPKIDGLTICKSIRAQQDLADIPIIMLTAKSEESDVVIGLELGADDYLTKPFSPKELLARMKAVLRRQNPDMKQSTAKSNRISVGPVILDIERHEAFLNHETLTLTLAEFKIIATLMSRPGRVFSREQLLEKVTGGDVYVIDRNIDVHVRSIRKKLGNEADFIFTVRGVGYKCRE